MGRKQYELENGASVTLSTWEGLEPPTHGKTLLSRDWDPDASRVGLAFYKSTEEYMRNEWAAANMHPTVARLGNESVQLFYNASSGSWHTAEALDIDHRVQWKDHLKALDVANMAEAQMAYNDVSNLRLLPAAINRARDSADKVLADNGPQSQEWREWCAKRFGFDPANPPPAYDPERDAAKRRASTQEAEWTSRHTRKDLSFDSGVQNKWFESELAKSHVGSVQVQRPVPPHDVMQVPLFRCAATQQLCTRDSFDIDHQIAFESLLKALPDHTADGTLSKADVLDAYNETSNLRLVSRAANASHEWELNAHGQYHDAEMEIPEQPGEFDGFITEQAMASKERSALDAAIVEFRERERFKSEVGRDLHESGILDFRDPRAQHGPVPQLSDPSHPDHGSFRKVWDRLAEIDPRHEVLPTDGHRDNLAAALVAEARRQGLRSIDAVAPGGPDGTLLFAVQKGQATDEHVHVGVTRGAMTPMAYSTAQVDQALAQAQQVQQVQAQTHAKQI